MRLTNHLLSEKIEGTNPDEIELLNFIYKNCKPFIKDLRRMNAVHGLYRGMKNRDLVTIKTTRTDRRPIDTNIYLHTELDDYFEDKFGLRLRSETVFCTGDWDFADRYGTHVFLVLPIGRYEIYWSEDITDLYNEVRDLAYDDFDSYTAERDWEEQYGENEEGTWYSPDTGDSYRELKDNAADAVYDQMFTPEEQEDEDHDQHYEWEQIYNNLEWEPDVDMHDFVEERRMEWDERRREQVQDVVDRYKKGDLKNAIYSENEIMMKCKSYLAIRIHRIPQNEAELKRLRAGFDIGGRILYYITKGIKDPRQMDLPFK